jgi:hypothetical protein
VVLGAADAQRRRNERVDALSEQLCHVVAEQRVCSQRHVQSVLLGRTERHHDGVTTAVDGSLDLRPCQLVEVVRGHGTTLLAMRILTSTKARSWAGCLRRVI